MSSKHVDQTRRGLVALLLAWPALLFLRLTRAFEAVASRVRRRSLPETVKVERYSFAVHAQAELGKACEFVAAGSPSMGLAVDRIIANAPGPGFVVLRELSIDGVNVLVGTATDAFTFSPIAMGGPMLLPPMRKGARVVARGSYTGFVPPGYSGGTPYLLTFHLMGRPTPSEPVASVLDQQRALERGADGEAA